MRQLLRASSSGQSHCVPGCLLASLLRRERWEPGTGPAACMCLHVLPAPPAVCTVVSKTSRLSHFQSWQHGHFPSTSRSMLWPKSLPGFSGARLPSPEHFQGLPLVLANDLGSVNGFGFQFKMKISVTVKTLLFTPVPAWQHASPALPMAPLPAERVVFQRASCAWQRVGLGMFV